MTKSKPSILVVEDEKSLSDALKLNLELEGYEVVVADTGKKAINTFKSEHFDCILLDIMLPEMDGLTVCETIRVQNNDVPILFLSAKDTGADRVAGLKRGGDDYMTKPFNLEELILRVEKLIEKNEQIHSNGKVVNEITFGPNRIDFQAQECVDKNGEAHTLTKKELMLLKLLVESQNEVVTRERILKTVWGYNVYPSTRTIDNFVLTFRKYFEQDSRNPEFFHSIRGVGYKFTNK